MLSRRGFCLNTLLATAGGDFFKTAPARPDEQEQERATGLAAPHAPQGASGGWPVYRPDDSV